jgi:hypothetical protein
VRDSHAAPHARTVQNLERRGSFLSDLDIQQLRRAALRIDAGRATRFNFIDFEGDRFLVVASLTRGAITYRWSFDKIDSLTGAISVGTDSTDDHVFAISALRNSLVSMGRGIAYDDVGRATRRCPNHRCLLFNSAVSELLGSSSPGQGPKVEGLRGSRAVRVAPQGCAAGTECTVIVTGGIPRDEVPCGVGGQGISGPGLPTGRAPAPLACQGLSFEVVQVDGPVLFTNVSIDPRGNLELALVGGTQVRFYFQ